MTIFEKTQKRSCQNCGVDISKKQINAKFCSNRCRQENFNKKKYSKADNISSVYNARAEFTGLIDAFKTMLKYAKTEKQKNEIIEHIEVFELALKYSFKYSETALEK